MVDDLNFDIDEIIKKVDAKLAELEEEEKQNAAAENESSEVLDVPPVPDAKVTEFEDKNTFTPTQDRYFQSTDASRATNMNYNSEPPKSSVVTPKSEEIDILEEDSDDKDEFFDDFFDDGE